MNYTGKRQATRLMSNAYNKGIVCGQVENTTVQAYSKESDVTSAESIRTCLTEGFYGREYVRIVKSLNDKSVFETVSVIAEVDNVITRFEK